MLYRFGNARLDLAARELICNGVERSLTPKAYDLLRLLIEFRPRVLTKAEIMDLIWPDAFVAEANVGILIGDIRAAIGDTANAGRLIKTHHGVGYSFCGDVVEQPRVAAIPPGGARFVLVIGERRIMLSVGTALLGRDIQSDVIVTDPSVSRHHARLEVTPSRVEVEDVGSKNGTSVNGQPIATRTEVADGAVIVFGSVVGTIHAVNTDGQSTATVWK
jgi:DNA-binding winged helix-turn-helix (wHTH) protein